MWPGLLTAHEYQESLAEAVSQKLHTHIGLPESRGVWQGNVLDKHVGLKYFCGHFLENKIRHNKDEKLPGIKGATLHS